MKGLLHKRSSGLPHKWQERHFELVGRRLLYRKGAKPGSEVKREWDLSKPNTLAFIPDTTSGKEIELHIGDESLVVLRAESATKAKLWVDRILAAAMPAPSSSEDASEMTARRRKLIEDKAAAGAGVQSEPVAIAAPARAQFDPSSCSYSVRHTAAALVIQLAARSRIACQVLKKRAKMNRTREKVIMEIYQTEKSYAKSLQGTWFALFLVFGAMKKLCVFRSQTCATGSLPLCSNRSPSHQCSSRKTYLPSS